MDEFETELVRRLAIPGESAHPDLTSRVMSVIERRQRARQVRLLCVTVVAIIAITVTICACLKTLQPIFAEAQFALINRLATDFPLFTLALMLTVGVAAAAVAVRQEMLNNQ
jgi:hypothetical protein